MTQPYIEKIKALAERAPKIVAHLQTEEATKNAMVMPFIAALGYDVFNPLEVVPEFTADVGTKKGEKVDYVVKRGEEIVMLVEAKQAATDLGKAQMSQLFRYFSVTKAKIALLTNGIVYRFYTDLDEPNKMDSKPFLEIDLSNLNQDVLPELEHLVRDTFSLSSMLGTALKLKYLQGIRRVLDSELTETSEEFAKFIFSKTNPNMRFAQSAREKYPALVNRAFKLLVADKVAELTRPVPEAPEQPEVTEMPPSVTEDGIVTTEDELEGFRVVKAITCSVLQASRIAYRDSQRHFSVLVDGTNRRQICKLYFNEPQKCIGIFDESKNETKHAIDVIDDIYKYKEQLQAIARYYATQVTTKNKVVSE